MRSMNGKVSGTLQWEQLINSLSEGSSLAGLLLVYIKVKEWEKLCTVVRSMDMFACRIFFFH